MHLLSLILVFLFLNATESEMDSTKRRDPKPVPQIFKLFKSDNQNTRNFLFSSFNPFTFIMNYIQNKIFGEIERDTHLAFVSGRESNVSSECLNSLKEFMKGLKERRVWALQMVDSFGKIPSGILSFTFATFGDFDLCVDTILPDKFQGRYCRVEMGRAQKKKKEPYRYFERLNLKSSLDNDVTKIFNKKEAFRSSQKLTTSICVPSTCSTKEVTHLLSKIFREDLDIDVYVPACYVKTNIDFTFGEMIIVILMSSLILFEVVATILDLKLRARCAEDIHKSSIISGTPVKCVLCFSFYSNLFLLFKKDENPNSIKIFHAMKVFSMAWIIYAHIVGLNMPINGRMKYGFEISGGFFFQILLSGPIAVETFFFMSGFLLVYSFIKANTPDLKFVQFALHRFFRLLPPILFMIGIVVLADHFYYGPLWQDYFTDYLIYGCKKSWWQNVLFINNLNEGPGRDKCINWTWYVAVDMQLYLGSYVLLLLLKKNARRTLFLLKVLVVLNVFLLVGTYAYYDLPPQPFLTYIKPEDLNLALMLTHYRTYNHITPYAIGMIAGYVIATKKKIFLSWGTKFLGWTMSLLFGVIALFTTYLWGSGDTPTLVESTLYGSLHRLLWSFMLFWIVYFCINSEGGVVNSILNWGGFVPLGRLTYLNYLVHPALMMMIVGTSRYVIYTERTTIFFSFVSITVVSYCLALILTLICESPFVRLESQLRKKNPITITKEVKKEIFSA